MKGLAGAKAQRQERESGVSRNCYKSGYKQGLCEEAVVTHRLKRSGRANNSLHALPRITDFPPETAKSHCGVLSREGRAQALPVWKVGKGGKTGGEHRAVVGGLIWVGGKGTDAGKGRGK